MKTVDWDVKTETKQTHIFPWIFIFKITTTKGAVSFSLILIIISDAYMNDIFQHYCFTIIDKIYFIV